MIERHYKIKPETIKRKVERYDSTWHDVLEVLKIGAGEIIGDQFNETTDTLSATLTDDEFIKDSRRYLEIALGLGVANFQSSLNPEEIFQINLNGEVVDIPGESTTAYMHANIWLNAIYVAIVSRDTDSIHSLTEIPESVHQTANIQSDPFSLAFVRLMKRLLGTSSKIQDVAQLLADAMEAADSDFNNIQKKQYCDLIIWPQLPIIQYILTKNSEAEFNEALEKAVSEHKTYWEKKSRDYDPQGWVSLPLIALSVLAYDKKGYEMNLETDYIPNWLVKKEF